MALHRGNVISYATPVPAPALAAPSPYAWTVVALLWVVALLNYLDRLLIASMRDPVVADLRITDAQFGLLTSVFLWVYAFVSPLGGFVADRLGRRWIITASLGFWSAATWLSGYARTFDEMLLARALMGVSEACYIPAALALIADYHRGSTRSLATGLHMSGIYAGVALGGVGGYLAERVGWRAGFRGFGVVGVAYCAVLVLALRDARRPAPIALAPLPGDDPPGGPLRYRSVIDEDGTGPRAGVRPTVALAALFGRGDFWVLVALNVLIGVVNWAIYGWLPTFLRTQFRLGLGASGLTATVTIQVASLAGVLAAGAWADRWSRTNRRARAIVPAIGYVLAGPCLAAAASTSLLPAAILGLVVFGVARGAFDANHMPLLRQVVDPRYSATGYGVLNLVNTTAGGVMVYAGGAMKDAHVDLAYVYQGCGAGLVLAGLLLFAVRVRPIAGR